MKWPCIFVFAALAAAPLAAITLDEYLALVLRTSPLVSRERLAPAVEEQNLARIGASRDVTLAAQGLYSRSKPVQTSPFVPTSLEITRSEASLSKLFWTTGGRLSLGASAARTSQDLPEILVPLPAGGSFSIPTGLETVYENTLTFSYTQPLLQDLGGTISRNAYRAGLAGKRSADALAAENIESFLAAEGASFIDWALFAELAKIAEERRRLTAGQLENVARMRRANLVDRTDLVRAQDALQSAEQGVLLAASQLRAKQAEIAIASGEPLLAGAVPEFDLYASAALPAEGAAGDELVTRARALAALRDQREALKLRADSAREAVRPALDLSLSYGFLDGADVIGEALGFERPAYSANLRLACPLGARAAGAALRSAELSLRQMDLALEKAGRDLRAALAALSIRLDDMTAVLELNRKQIALAAERTQAERDLYALGRGQLTFVIMALDSELAARASYASNAAGYQKMLLQYKSLTDTLYGDRERP